MDWFLAFKEQILIGLGVILGWRVLRGFLKARSDDQDNLRDLEHSLHVLEMDHAQGQQNTKDRNRQ